MHLLSFAVILFLPYSLKDFSLICPIPFLFCYHFILFFRYNDSLKFKYLLFSGISFGCCLMTKILVGFYIPMILFISYFFIKNEINIKLKDLVILTFIGIIIALPWHLYMLSNFGSQFTDYFFGFHIYDRALHGVEMNEKSSGMIYHINYLLSIIPYSILVFVALIKDFADFKKLNWKKIFLYVWFLTGLVILTLFKTKLEVYILMILVPACFIIPLLIEELGNEKLLSNILILFFVFANATWFATESFRPEIKNYLSQLKYFSILIILNGNGIDPFFCRQIFSK